MTEEALSYVTEATPECPIKIRVYSCWHPVSVLGTLSQIGVSVPDELTRACADERPLWTTGRQIPVEEVEAAQVAHEWPEPFCAWLKDAMQRLKILQA